MISYFFKKNKPDAYNPTGYLQKKTAQELLVPYSIEIQDIKELTGLPEEHFRHFYMRPLERYVESIQLLPASESHHHSQVGGMLQHSLEVLINALRLRRGQILPPGIIPEEIEQRKDVWTYAVFLCALLHDIGKIITDQKMVAPGKKQSWNLLSSKPMPELYECAFNTERKHKFHEKMPAFVLHKFIDSDAFDWLMSDPDVFAVIVNFMSGDMHSAGVVGEIVQKADQASVVGNLGGDIAQAVKSPAQRPLSERLLRTLQTLVQENSLPINRKGAAGFTTEDAVYFVSKRLLDELKERMRQDGQSVPERNDRLMDELQQFGIIEANDDKAIWKCLIKIGDWEANLSMLKIQISKVWPNLESRPEANPELEVVPIDINGKPLDQVDLNTNKANEPERKKEPKLTTVNERISEKKKNPECEETSQNKHDSGLQIDKELSEIEGLIKTPDNLVIEEDLSEFNDLDEGEYAGFDSLEIDVKSNDDEQENEGKASIEACPEDERKQIVDKIANHAKQAITGAVDKHNEDVFSSSDIPLEFDDPNSLGAQFVKWLVNGIKSGAIEVNQPSNRVHVVPEGLFLVSPAIFRMFSSETGGDWARAQREITRKKINLKTPKGENIFKYEIFSKSGRNSAKVVKGILIPNFDSKLGLILNEQNEWMKQIP